jgi:hypothetical protein
MVQHHQHQPQQLMEEEVLEEVPEDIVVKKYKL